eukprot:TRINITY_DN75633_c0_g1_i1.p1 TRINITY_DN75633_c0_g1~~TRINITY_DN75633_c0_g1_i1.p1  ORF type:complete len:386 (+),score=47.81 TRINITY_DN75633_c0_g1_i1:138-1295(+)
MTQSIPNEEVIEKLRTLLSLLSSTPVRLTEDEERIRARIVSAGVDRDMIAQRLQEYLSSNQIETSDIDRNPELAGEVTCDNACSTADHGAALSSVAPTPTFSCETVPVAIPIEKLGAGKEYDGSLGPLLHVLNIQIEGLERPLQLLEVIDSQSATAAMKAVGEEDPFGVKVWPMAYVCARRLIDFGVMGKTVLELGCGTGLVSIAAALGGASFVFATDRCRGNVLRAAASARMNGIHIHTEVFDVTDFTMPLPRPRIQSADGVCHATAVFDYLVFSDVLYWPKEAAAFGRRAAEAYAAGTTVIVADPGRRSDDFFAGMRAELDRLDVEPRPPLDTHQAYCPEHVYDWVSPEVKVASSLFCRPPFELMLQPVLPSIGKHCFAPYGC